jgi:hypothetical protein
LRLSLRASAAPRLFSEIIIDQMTNVQKRLPPGETTRKIKDHSKDGSENDSKKGNLLFLSGHI